MRRWLAACAAAVLWIGVPDVSADTVLMHDGRMFYGEIQSETETEVTIKAKIGNIIQTITLKKAEIASMDRPGFGVRDGWWDEQADPAKQPLQAVDASSYLLIPIKGTIGVDATAWGVEKALEWGRERSVRHSCSRSIRRAASSPMRSAWRN